MALGTNPSQTRHKKADPMAALAHPCASRHLHIHVQWPNSHNVFVLIDR